MMRSAKKAPSKVMASTVALVLVLSLLPVGLAWGDEDQSPAPALAFADEGVFLTLAQADAAGAIEAPPADPTAYVEDEIIVVYADTAPLTQEIALVEEGLAELSDTDETPITELLDADFEGQSLATISLPEDVSVADALLMAANSDEVLFAQPNYIYWPLEDSATIDSPIDGYRLELSDDSNDSNDSGDSEESEESDDPDNPATDPSVQLDSFAPPSVTPNDLYKDEQWALAAVNAFQAWGYIAQKYASTQRPSVSVGILDTGMRMDHQDLVGNLASDAYGALAWDAYNARRLLETAVNSSIPNNSAGAFGGHGTHVAGIIAAIANNGVGVAGVSYNSKIIPVSLVNTTNGNTMNTSTAIVGISYLRGLRSSANVRVLNMSFGGIDYDVSLHSAISGATNDGILCVVAAGNINSSLPSGVTVYPAAYPEVISVANLASSYQRSNDSQYHATLDIAAPGSSIYSTWCTDSSSYTYSSGTSMAAPLVAGIAALLFTYDPNLTPAQVKQVLYDTARDRVSSDANDALGWDPYYGWGMIDAAKALAVLEQVGGSYSKYSVTYHNNGADAATNSVPRDQAGYHPATSGTPSPGYSPAGYYKNSQVTVLAPTASGGNLARANWVFQGWSTSANGPLVYSAAAISMGAAKFSITTNVNLYPVWKENPKYSVTYYNTGANAGTNRPPVDSVGPYYSGKTATVLSPNAGSPAGNLAQAGKVFAGWDTSSAANTVVYEPGDTFTITANVSLYPVWTNDYNGAIVTLSASTAANQLIDVSGRSSTRGASLILYSKNNGAANQRFRLERVGSTDYFLIRNVNSGLVLDINGGSVRSGTAVIQWPINGGANQQWLLLPNANGTLTIASRANDNFCLDASGGSAANGTKLIIWQRGTNKANQQWRMTQLTRTIPDGIYNIRTMGTGKRSLDIEGNSTKGGAKMLLWDYGGPAKRNQQFRVTYQPNTGYYTMLSVNSGMSVDVNGGSTTAGAQVIQWPLKTSNNLNQQWSIADNGAGNGSYWIIGAQSGLSLDVSGGNVANNGRIITWAYHGRYNQQWSFTKVG